MKLVKPSYSIIEPTGYTIDDIYKSIELAGRVSYKSEDRITEDSAKGFVDMLIKRKHYSPLEFGTVCLYINNHNPSFNKIIDKYYYNKYSKCRVFSNKAYISTNYRVIVENSWQDDLKYLCEPTEFHSKRVCVKFICDRGISHELVRHRIFSFMQESSRYCNYSLGKFNKELTFIEPCWFKHDLSGQYVSKEHIIAQTPQDNYEESELLFLYSLLSSEQYYLSLIDMKWRPEQARAVLPNAIKTELFMCGFIEDWKKFFLLRTPTNAHPQMRELTIPLQEEFISKHYIK